MKTKTVGVKKAFVGRVKVYGKGTINLPKEVLELLKVSKGRAYPYRQRRKSGVKKAQKLRRAGGKS